MRTISVNSRIVFLLGLLVISSGIVVMSAIPSGSEESDDKAAALEQRWRDGAFDLEAGSKSDAEHVDTVRGHDWPEGIFEEGFSLSIGPDISIANVWQGEIRGVMFAVGAGHKSSDSSQGVIVIRAFSQDIKVLSERGGVFEPESTTGQLRVASAANGMVEIEGEGGQTYTLDVWGRSLTTSSGAVAWKSRGLDSITIASSSSNIGRAGGEVVGRLSGRTVGARVTAPADALATDREVTIRNLDVSSFAPKPPANTFLLVDLSPDGLTFDKTVTIELEWDDSLIPEDDESNLTVSLSTGGDFMLLAPCTGGALAESDQPCVSDVDTDQNRVRVLSRHFSTYALSGCSCVSIDTDVTGNSASSLGSIDACQSVWACPAFPDT